MADQQLVTCDRRADDVALIRLDHPKANALSSTLLRQLAAIVRELEADLPGAVVVAGSERIFAAGADITEFDSPGAAERISEDFTAALDALAALPRLSIAAINGFALGGGCELALACDLRVCGAGAKLGQPEILLGIIPGAGGTQRLTRLVGLSRAKDLVCTGRPVRAEEALQIGLVDRVVPDTDVLDTALAMAADFARGPLVALALAKAAVDGGAQGSLADGLAIERQAFIDVFSTEDSTIGVKSFLADGPGKANFVGR